MQACLSVWAFDLQQITVENLVIILVVARKDKMLLKTFLPISEMLINSCLTLCCGQPLSLFTHCCANQMANFLADANDFFIFFKALNWSMSDDTLLYFSWYSLVVHCIFLCVIVCLFFTSLLRFGCLLGISAFGSFWMINRNRQV